MRNPFPHAHDHWSHETTEELPIVTRVLPHDAHETRPRAWTITVPRPRSSLTKAVVAVAVLVAAAALTDLGISLTRHTAQSTVSEAVVGKPKGVGARTHHHGKTVAAKHRPLKGAPKQAHQASSSSGGAPGAPALYFVMPRHAHPGETIYVHGTNLFSSNGVVLARLDGRPSRTSCPSRNVCDVTVPDLPGVHGWVRIVIGTSAGKSNPAWFRYLSS